MRCELHHTNSCFPGILHDLIKATHGIGVMYVNLRG